MTGKETSYFFSFSQKVPPLKVFHTRYKCVLFFDFGLIGIQSISSIVLISLTAKLAITGDWGRPQQAGLQIRTEGRMLQMLHLYIQMPCLRVCRKNGQRDKQRLPEHFTRLPTMDIISIGVVYLFVKVRM